MSSKHKESDVTKKAGPLPPAYTEGPPPYEPSGQRETLPRPLKERTARIEANSTRPQSNAKTITDEELVKLTLKWVPPPPPSRPVCRLQKPVAVPQIDRDSYITGATPYLRAYSPALDAHDVFVTDFLAFCDSLTIAQAPSPPIQVADLIGTGLGFVPDLWAQLTSLGIGIAAGAAAEVTNVARTKLFLKKANAEYFAPRGLKVSVQPDQQLQQLLGLPPSQSPLAPIDTRSGCISVTDRRLRALGDNIAPLTTDVQAPMPPRNLIDRLSAKQVQARIRKNREKAVKKAEEREKKEMKRATRRSTSNALNSAIGPSSESLAITPITSSGSGGAPGLWTTQSYPLAGYPISPDYPSPAPAPSASASWSTSKLEPQQWQTPLPPHSQPQPQHPPSRALQRLELKKKSINLEADKQLLEGEHAPDSKKAARIEKKRAEKLAEVERRLAKEVRREEKKKKRVAKGKGKGKAVKKDNDENDDGGNSSDDSSSSSSSDNDSESESDREEKAREALEKDQKKAGKLRWIVVQNLPDEGAFPRDEAEEVDSTPMMARLGRY